MNAKEFLRGKGIHSETVFSDINEKRICTLGELLEAYAHQSTSTVLSDEEIETGVKNYYAGLESIKPVLPATRKLIEFTWSEGAKWTRDQHTPKNDEELPEMPTTEELAAFKKNHKFPKTCPTCKKQKDYEPSFCSDAFHMVPKTAESEWISVDERLPDSEQICDIWHKSGVRITDVEYIGLKVTKEFRTHEGLTFDMTGIHKECFVTHWKIPSPPNK